MSTEFWSELYSTRTNVPRETFRVRASTTTDEFIEAWLGSVTTRKQYFQFEWTETSFSSHLFTNDK